MLVKKRDGSTLTSDKRKDVVLYFPQQQENPPPPTLVVEDRLEGGLQGGQEIWAPEEHTPNDAVVQNEPVPEPPALTCRSMVN